MPILRKRTRTLDSPIINDEAQAQHRKKLSGYEQSREERIRENLERMEKLGIANLSLKLKAVAPPKLTPKKQADRKAAHQPTPVAPSGPPRRSSRLQNATPVSYSEVHLAKKDEGILLEAGVKPEVYTEEHEKLLGNTERSWTLFVDGYRDGERIYDQVRGKTCHQCRQKTLGHRTHCSKCNLVQGQFCGDCLYMRYGEHVFEAMENPNWICPACRGICNCSLCRNAKGWPPTGALYKKISNLGYKSVAHYLIQTRRVQSNLGENSDTINQVSAKRSLPFTGVEALPKESLKVDDTHFGPLKPQSEDKKDDEFKSEKENEMKSRPDPDTNNQVSTKRSLHFSDMQAEPENMKSTVVNHDHIGLKPQSEEKRGDEFNGEKEKELHFTDKGHGDSNIVLEGYPKLEMKQESSSDTILRQKHIKSNGHDDELLGLNEKTSDIKQAINKYLSEKEVEKETEMSTDNKHGDANIALENSPKLKKPALVTKSSTDSNAGRLRWRHREGNDCDDEIMNGKTSDVKQAVNLSEKEVEEEKKMHSEENKHGNGNVALNSSPKLKKSALTSEPSIDSIAGRLRQRRRKGNGYDDEELPGMNWKTSDVKKAVNSILSVKEAELNMRLTISTKPILDGIA